MFHVKPRIVVIGGGHAGCEAADAVARMGVDVVLVTQRADRIGEMSCNPAIGGLGKGHLVREIDALDGLMGRVADQAGIQFRLLNRGKGPAVRGPRAQCDRALYRRHMQAALAARPGLQIIEAEVVDLMVRKAQVCGVVLSDQTELNATAVVLTTGTFLGGVIHLGPTSRPAGRVGDAASTRLAARLREMGLPMGRLKTGTPPRLDKRTIDYSQLEAQLGDAVPELFSFQSRCASARQVECHITHTNPTTHQIITANLHLSAMYSGRIEGIGPRYCPSIEDKVTRFSDKDSHQVFLEPEGLDSDIVYPNGISTSLPAEVQIDYVRSIKGLERAEITQPGYAIEYDYLDPKSLTPALSLKSLDGLFLAGQINGTTGYEEAAGQGLVAGLNAAAFVQGRDPILFDRADGYLGVMIDDLVTQGVSEPYRMFTSRAEYRLSLRADNADQRLTPIGLRLGCVGPDRGHSFGLKMAALDALRAQAKSLSLTPNEAQQHGLAINQDGIRRTALDLLGFPGIDFTRLAQIWPSLLGADPAIVQQLENDASYAGYLSRQAADVTAMRNEEARLLAPDLDYTEISGLSVELRKKLKAVAPRTLGQASRIEGMTPAALALLLAMSRRSGSARGK